MRIPNLSVSDSVTRTIRDLELKRFELDQQISSGQKLKLPEDDGLKVGRLINLESEKSNISQYKRNSSQAKEFLNAGHLNIDHLRQLNQRALEIARVAGTELNQSAAETYGHEINELVEEALNRVNSSHRGTALFAGNELNPKFGNSEVLLGQFNKTSISLNDSLVGEASADGNRILSEGEYVVFKLNGREYVVEATKDGLTTSKILEVVESLINEDQGTLDQSPRLPVDPSNPDPDFPWYRGFVRGGEGDNSSRNENASISATISNNGDLVLNGAVNQSYHASVDYYTHWKPNTYFPEQVEEKIAKQTEIRFPGLSFQDLSEADQEIIRQDVYKSGASSFDQNQFELVLDSKASLQFRDEYESAVPSDWTNLQQANQEIIWRDAYDEFYNNGDLVFNLSNQQVFDLTGLTNSGGNYSFQNYQDTTDALLPMTGYLKPMELNADGVWGRSSNSVSNDDVKITDPSFYVSGQKYNQTVDEFDNLKVVDYIIDQNIQSGINTQPVGAAPVMSWVRDVSVESDMLTSSSSINIEHSNPWQRLSRYDLGDLVEYDGKLWESQIEANFNRKPGDEGNYWKEIPSNYSIEREDWNLSTTAIEERIFFLSPDGRLFDNQLDAQFHTEDLLLESKTYENTIADLSTDASALVKEIVYPVSHFAAKGSESDSFVFFDSVSQSYRLVASDEDGEVVNGQYVKGNIVDSTNDPAVLLNGSVALHEGRYFVVTDENSLDTSVWSSLNETNLQGGGASLLPKGLPKEGLEKTLLQGTGNSVSGFAGDIVFQRTNDVTNFGEPVDRYFLALNNYTNVSDLGNSASFVEVNASSAMQGSTWASNETYDSGQIVYYKGSYYQARSDGLKNNVTVNDDLGNFVGQFTVFPDDDFYINEFGESVKNTLWVKLSDEGNLNHVLSFEIDNQNEPKLRIPEPGSSGRVASAEAVVDASGEVAGLRVKDGGSYFFGSSIDSTTIPSDFEKVKIDLSNGGEMEATIIWQEDNTTGSYFISGFENPTVITGSNSGSKATSSVGDTFSFATGSKSFLDHRDENGDLINVSYLGGDESSRAMVGTETELSFLLDASNQGTESLGDVVNTMVDLRNGLLNPNSISFAEEVQTAERELISSEDDLVDKMGELAASLTRIETVNSHDEEYSLSIDKQIANDLEVDLSEAIMRLSRVSMAYQAAMQVGSQMLNNSLLNYL